MTGRRGRSLTQRLRDKTEIVGECWLWTGGVAGAGYGVLNVNGRLVKVHRVSYEQHVGPIPAGQELHHTCRNKRGWRPLHLELVTHRANLILGPGAASRNARAAMCVHGHPFDSKNTYVYRGTRQCRKCRAKRERERQAGKRLAP